MSRISRDEMFMKIAYIVAERGTCPRAKVGAVLVGPDNKIKSIGYNGSPSGEPHCEDVGCTMEDGHCKSAIHAERNCLNHLRMLGPYKMYVTHIPCEECKKVIIKFNKLCPIKVVYDIPYRYEGPDSFTEGGVHFERYQR